MSRSSLAPLKKSKNNSTDDDDEISNLPEDVIGQILSLMPTKDAVRTSVLSRDWEYKWTSIYKVDICDKHFQNRHHGDFNRQYTTKASFVKFVERIVLFSKNITSFSLSMCCEYDSTRIRACICSVLMSSIAECITVTYYSAGAGYIVLPRSLLHNTSLRKLELDLCGIFKFNVPTRSSFPNLRSLKLSRVDILNESSSSDTLSLTFPVLETFELIDCRLLNMKIMEIHAPVLGKFHRKCPEWATTNEYKIKILSTRLVEFLFSGAVPEKFVFVGQQVTHATLSYPVGTSNLKMIEEAGVHAQIFLNEFTILKELNISASFTQAIVRSRTGIYIPMLHHLVRLFVSTSPFNAKGLLELLYATPILKFLNVCMSDENAFVYDVVERVPLCIQDSMEKVEFKSFDAKRSQLSLVKFLLANGRKLKEIHFSGCSRYMNKDKVREQLSKFPKCSACVTFHVT